MLPLPQANVPVRQRQLPYAQAELADMQVLLKDETSQIVDSDLPLPLYSQARFKIIVLVFLSCFHSPLWIPPNYHSVPWPIVTLLQAERCFELSCRCEV